MYIYIYIYICINTYISHTITLYLYSGVCDRFASFEDARAIVRAYRIPSALKFRSWPQRPVNIPARPQLVYKEDWNSWSDFLGNNNQPTKKQIHKEKDAERKRVARDNKRIAETQLEPHPKRSLGNPSLPSTSSVSLSVPPTLSECPASPSSNHSLSENVQGSSPPSTGGYRLRHVRETVEEREPQAKSKRRQVLRKASKVSASLHQICDGDKEIMQEVIQLAQVCLCYRFVCID